MLDIAQCHILHRRSNECMDSYVLSESSMFISDARIILKTCGRTRLLHAMDTLLNLAHRYSHMDSVINVFYSRKNFMRPEIQPHPHNSFEGEIDFLDNYFQDRWFLYTISAPQAPLPYADHTLEIMMSEMPHDVMSVFTRAKSGIDRVVPFGTIIHEELFDPCGYSMNGLLPQTDQYVTIHVTPEPDFSYASFETNQNSMCLYKQTLRVIDIFKIQTRSQVKMQNFGLERIDEVDFHAVQHETLVYAQYVKRKGTGTKNVPLKRAITDDDGNSD
uniref:Adenosylmethionine decarboxylase n=1 Tax=Parascaris equorum TaxID=6256 RepID=A0A914S8G9_PAREQ